MTRSERLTAIVRSLWPTASAPPAAYSILTTPANGRRLLVATEDGGTAVGNGPTLEAALTDLEAKLGLAEVTR